VFLYLVDAGSKAAEMSQTHESQFSPWDVIDEEEVEGTDIECMRQDVNEKPRWFSEVP
jgi:hypothetical protein